MTGRTVRHRQTVNAPIARVVAAAAAIAAPSPADDAVAAKTVDGTAEKPTSVHTREGCLCPVERDSGIPMKAIYN